MLGLIAIYYIGKSFYDLASYHQKNKWSFVFAGLGVFYGAQILFGLFLGIFYPASIDSMSIAINIGGLVVGGIAGVSFYSYLKNKWKNALDVQTNPDILDDIV